jgi:hypothetical protein
MPSLKNATAITSLNPACKFSGQYETLVVNAHGYAVIVRELREREMPVTVELVSNGLSKQGRVVLVRSVVVGASWLLELEFDNPAGDFWEIENPPADWRGYLFLRAVSPVTRVCGPSRCFLLTFHFRPPRSLSSCHLSPRRR